jgi:hypothetical protein
MGSWLSEREQRLVAGAEEASAATPLAASVAGKQKLSLRGATT